MTNGDAAADGLRLAGCPGIYLPWRDVLHEGPVPGGLALPALGAIRAAFIADAGWDDADAAREGFAARDALLADAGSFEEVILWFEHDLYDQLQLLQTLDWFAERPDTRLSLVQTDTYLGSLRAEDLQEAFAARRPVSAAQLQLAGRAWAAFRAPDPSGLARIVHEDLSLLPHLGAALRRHLEQFPGCADGLSRSERTIVRMLTAGPVPGAELFRRLAAAEEAEFLGDTVFAWYLYQLSAACTHPLIVDAGGTMLTIPRTDADRRTCFARTFRLTEAGRAVALGREDRIGLNGIDRWLGGVHLRSPDRVWRWDPEDRRLGGPA